MGVTYEAQKDNKNSQQDDGIYFKYTGTYVFCYDAGEGGFYDRVN